MNPLPYAIPSPLPKRTGDVGIRSLKMTDAVKLRELLKVNRGWLSPWEATLPGGGNSVPGSFSMRPTIRLLKKQQRAGVSVHFAVTYRERLVGQLSVSEISAGALRSASIGYWVSADTAGKGVMPLAVAMSIDYVFVELGLHRVEICIRPENQASLRVVEKLCMRYEGLRQRYIYIDGDWRDHYSFAVHSDELRGSMLERIGAAYE